MIFDAKPAIEGGAFCARATNIEASSVLFCNATTNPGARPGLIPWFDRNSLPFVRAYRPAERRARGAPREARGGAGLGPRPRIPS